MTRGQNEVERTVSHYVSQPVERDRWGQEESAANRFEKAKRGDARIAPARLDGKRHHREASGDKDGCSRVDGTVGRVGSRRVDGDDGRE